MAEIEGFKKSYLLIFLLKIGVLFEFVVLFIFPPKIQKSEKVKTYDCEKH
jgi:hypothetical protein